ncbi:hypothetical protein [Streptococcus loxodontisalivarius]|uniref:Phage protein n=1 Tax=Streptococcus loxodontisalivarius TaxID=1349415 RepID=A0ABS2PQ47_9STRE|nr:hypothetical protein [Streptococcus loxodontisalivarius]MBM7642166.1 hypothetical protein [Streptococcus loxodontisalivarius]
MKKWLFGDINYQRQSKDGKLQTEFSLKGGMIPNLLFWGIIIGLITWLVMK